METKELVGLVNAHMLQRERLLRQIEALDDALPTLVKSALSQVPREQYQELAEALYWGWEGAIPASIIAPLVGASDTQLYRSMPPTTIEVHCVDCGEPFELPVVSRSELRNARGQSRWRQNRCPSCSAAAAAKAGEERRRHAAMMRARKVRLAELKSMPYREYLQSPEWQATRQRALKRANYRCQVCNGGGRLDVHHRTYVRRGEEAATDVIVLCRDCHALYHDDGRMPE